ncbi:hypothetical protein LMH73_014455 [Vibrio splendidus]|nr:hypothetical protein [Vibrio splendidus]MCC4882504.1 hypothetical protein [Vibrio splendidus]
MKRRVSITAIELLEEAITNNGVFTIHTDDTKTHEDRFDAIYALSKWRLKTTVLFSKILFSGSATKQRSRKAMNDAIVFKTSNSIGISMYAALHIPPENNNIESLKAFLDFFALYRTFAVKDTQATIQIATSPNQSELSCKLLFDDESTAISKEDKSDMSERLNVFINENSVVEDWLRRITSDLSRYIGIWAWSTIPAESVITERDLWGIREAK